MKLHFNTVIRNIINGEPLRVADGVGDGGVPKTKDLTLAGAALEALLSMDPNARETGEQKAKAYALAHRIVKAKDEPIEVTAEEIVLLKSKIGDLFSPAVVGPAFELLEDRVIGEA